MAWPMVSPPPPYGRHANLPNIFELIENIQRLESQVSRISFKANSLIERREVILPQVTLQLLENYQHIKRLMERCQLELPSQEEDQKESLIFAMEHCGFKELSVYHEPTTLHSSTTLPPSTSTTSQSSAVTEKRLKERERDREGDHLLSTEEEFLNENLDRTNTASNQLTSHGPHTKSISIQPPPAPNSSAPRETPRSRVQFTGTITPEEFEKIPSHVRGRCSLHDTQRLLTHLRSEYASYKTVAVGTATPPPMNIQQLDQLGYRVCGQTGLCMLKTLQKLGYVALSKRGDLVSLSALGMQGVAAQKRRR